MKKNMFQIILSILFLTACIACPPVEEPKPTTLKLQVFGMTCSGCEKSVKQLFENQSGIKSAVASKAENSVQISYNPQQISETDLLEKFTNTHYSETENNSRVVVLPVKGMTCSKCVQKIQSSLSAINGVQSVDANFEKSTVTITYEPSKTSIESLVREIQAKQFVVEGY